MRIITLSLLLCVVTSPVPLRADPPPVSPAAAAKKKLENFVHDAAVQAFGQLGMGPVQKKIFEEEALADAGAFVSNYRSNGDGTDVQIDKEKLKNYLRFAASLFKGSVDGAPPKLCVRVRAAPGCATCERLTAVLNESVASRFSRRGFEVAPGPVISEDSALMGEHAYDEFAARGAEARCDGILYGEMTPEHSADADEDDNDVKVQWTAYLSLRNLVGRKVKVHAQSSAQVSKELGNDSANRQYASQLAGRATIDLFAQAAAQSSSAPAVKLAEGADEHYLRLEGVTSYASYIKFKQVVAVNMPELKLEERFISPGAFQFSVPPSLALERVGQQLTTLPWGGQTLTIVRNSSDELAVTLK